MVREFRYDGGDVEMNINETQQCPYCDLGYLEFIRSDEEGGDMYECGDCDSQLWFDDDGEEVGN